MSLREILARLIRRRTAPAPRTRTITGPPTSHPGHKTALPDMPPDLRADPDNSQPNSPGHDETRLAARLRDRGVHPGGRP